VTLVLWTGTLIYLFQWVYATRDFFIVAAIVAIVMGGSQALSRSLFAQLIPPGKEAEYFGIYEVSDKGTSWVSPLVFGLALQITHSYRQAILSLIIFFIAGLAVLTKLDVQRGEADAKRQLNGRGAPLNSDRSPV
jgi:UMF1 family MFS transporter